MSEREQEARRQRLEALREQGVEPFPARVGPRVPVAQVRDRYDALSAEELEAERIAREAEIAEEVKRRKDLALLGTYLTVEEIKLHRDRRVELFEAQTRVTELYLTNLERRLNKLKQEASHYTPYSPDPDAPMIDPELVADINETQATIDRHKNNLQKYERDVAEIIRRFETDINRFRELKGITQVVVDSGSS